jgi:putative transposase
MLAFSLKKNLVFSWCGNTYRIDRLQPKELLIEKMDSAQMSLISKDRLLAEYSSGNITVAANNLVAVDNIPCFSRPLSELPEITIKRVSLRQRYVEAVFAHGESPLSTKVHAKIIKVVSVEIGDSKPPSPITLYRWCRRYLSQRDTRALIPRCDRRGRRCSLSEQVIELLADATQEAFAASPQAMGTNIYARLVTKLHNINRREPNASLKVPSLATVYRYLSRLDAYDKVCLREGKRIANARFRLAIGGTETSKILERIEIDHTPLDLFLVDDKTFIPFGRPTLTVAIDHYSRMPVGYYLSYSDPSVPAVIGTLRHAILPKKAANQVIKSLQAEHRWPCYGLFDALVMDNGLEFHGSSLDGIAFDLGFRLQFCPKKEPRFKGVIERYLKTINYFFASQLPGTTYSKLHLRQDYDPTKHSLLTFNEFVQILEKWFLDVYAQTIHRGIGTSPWVKWHQGCEQRLIELPTSLDALSQRIGVTTSRSLRQGGINIEGIRYNSNALGPILTAYGPGIKVRVTYDPDDLGKIHVWGPGHDEPVVVTAINQSYAAGLTRTQHRFIQAHLRKQNVDPKQIENLLAAKDGLARTIQELLGSRKQRDRKRAAAVRGVSSKHQAVTPEPLVLLKDKPRSERRKMIAPFVPTAPIAPLKSFHLKK